MKVFSVLLILIIALPIKSPRIFSREVLFEIRADQVKQQIEGFGVSGAWWAQDVGGWSQVNRDRITDLLFDQQKGIGLTIYRYNIGAGSGKNIIDPWRNTETFEVEEGKYDWGRDENAVRIMKEAHQKGVTNIIAFVNSPPARMTKTGYVTGGKEGKSNLREDMYDDFAQYLVDIVRHFREDESLPVKWISPINEPQWNWNNSKGQEGCHYTTDEIVEVIKVLLEKIEEEKLDVGVSAVDAGEWKTSYIYMDRLFLNKYINDRTDHFAVHSYWSTTRQKEKASRYFREQYPDKKLWMTEWTEMKKGVDYGMDSGLTMANVIHEDLVIAGVTSWQYWIAVSKYNYRDGLIYTDQYTENIRETKRLWILGNYSNFIRPGYKRIKVSGQHNDLRLSAYINGDRDRLVVVAINNSKKSREFVLDLVNFDGNKLDIYRTSETENLEHTYSGKVIKEFKLPARSVTTMVLTRL